MANPYAVSAIVEDAHKAERNAQEYRILTEAGAVDGRLEKAIQWSLSGYVAPTDDSVRAFVMDSLILFMRHMGEDAVPRWMLGPNGLQTNVYSRTLIKNAQKKLVAHATKKRKLEEDDA